MNSVESLSFSVQKSSHIMTDWCLFFNEFFRNYDLFVF